MFFYFGHMHAAQPKQSSMGIRTHNCCRCPAQADDFQCKAYEGPKYADWDMSVIGTGFITTLKTTCRTAVEHIGKSPARE